MAVNLKICLKNLTFFDILQEHMSVSQSHKLAIEKPRGRNEHPASHRNNNVYSVLVWENKKQRSLKII